MSRALRLAALLVLLAPGAAAAHSVQACLNSEPVKRAIATAIADCQAQTAAEIATLKAQVAQLEADLAAIKAECPVIARTPKEAAVAVGAPGPICVVVDRLTPCEGNYCGDWFVPTPTPGRSR